MRILILGGSGGMGRFASSAIAKFDNFDSLIIADLNEEAAKKFAASLDNEKIS